MKIGSFVKHLTERCKSLAGTRKIAFPEGNDPRILEASIKLLQDEIFSHVSLFGRQDEGIKKIQSFDEYDSSFIERIDWVEPDSKNSKNETFEFLKGKYAGKLIKVEEIESWARSPLYQAGNMLRTGGVDVALAGVNETTADVIRASMRTVGLQDGFKFLSGSFLMARGDTVYLYSDSGVIIDPNIFQLNDIARGSLQTWQRVVGTDPRIAFLSFSTLGSAKHPSAEKMGKAAENFAKAYPTVKSVGEIQFDAAIDQTVGVKKGMSEDLAGKCNVFLFPNLDAGNIAYKITQRLGGFSAFGPILQGLAMPFGDLSRGASADDIYTTACINLLLANRQ